MTKYIVLLPKSGLGIDHTKNIRAQCFEVKGGDLIFYGEEDEKAICAFARGEWVTVEED